MTKKKPTESEQNKTETPAKDENKEKEGEKKPDEHAPENRMSSFKLRTVTTLLMLGGFVLILSLGHSYCAILVVFLLILCFKELKALKRKKEEDQKIPFFNVINWYFFFCTLCFLFPMYLPTQTRTGITNPTLIWLSEYHKFISFCSFIAGILLFTLSLEQGTIKYQFKIFGWTLIVLLIVVSQCCAMIYNIYKGLYWFLFPALCVICNDIFAYIFGFFFGKTQLIKLSPKKTWEGFIGGAICTFIWAFIASYYLSGISIFVCPQKEITFEPFSFPKCDVSSIYVPQKYLFPIEIFGVDGFWLAPVQIHSLIIALFSSICAPFGGFFASGFKRAFRIKDFGASIPGHGGITDRFDCQMMMCMFTFAYLHQVVFKINPTVDGVINSLYKLSYEEQNMVLKELQSILFKG